MHSQHIDSVYFSELASSPAQIVRTTRMKNSGTLWENSVQLKEFKPVATLHKTFDATKLTNNFYLCIFIKQNFIRNFVIFIMQLCGIKIYCSIEILI